MDTQRLADSIYSSQRSPLSEATRQEPPQLLYENLQPDSHVDDPLPRLDTPARPGSIQLGSQGSEPPPEITMSACALLTPAALAAIGDSCASRVAGWIAEVRYNNLGGGADGANSWAVGGDEVVAGPVGAYELVAVGGWCTVEVRGYPAAPPTDDDGISAGDGEGLMDWEMVSLDGIRGLLHHFTPLP